LQAALFPVLWFGDLGVLVVVVVDIGVLGVSKVFPIPVCWFEELHRHSVIITDSDRLGFVVATALWLCY
jgi:hypothetical protein